MVPRCPAPPHKGDRAPLGRGAGDSRGQRQDSGNRQSLPPPGERNEGTRRMRQARPGRRSVSARRTDELLELAGLGTEAVTRLHRVAELGDPDAVDYMEGPGPPCDLALPKVGLKFAELLPLLDEQASRWCYPTCGKLGVSHDCRPARHRRLPDSEKLRALGASRSYSSCSCRPD